MIGYKLCRKRRDGTIGSLFIGKKDKYEVGKEYKAKEIPTKGFAVRKGFHILEKPSAPHLTEKGRVWYAVEFTPTATLDRPNRQGGRWYLSDTIRFIQEIKG